MIILISIVILIYCGLILSFIIGFDNIQSFDTKNSTSKHSFSIIIPFRNEAESLPVLLESLQLLDYPTDKFETLFIDDDSKDNSIEIIERYFDKINMTFKVIKNNRKTNSPKKDAINIAIDNAKFDWIITTDADCNVPKNWLKTFDVFIQEKQPKLVVAPVTYTVKTNFLEQFQLLDFLSLQGTAIGAFGIKKPFLCNGANLCYSKEIFKEVYGFEGNTNIASGDDIFLLEKIAKKYPKKVFYLKSKEAIVTTKPQQTLKQLINQRVRWASKSTATKNSFSKLVSFTVFGMNFLLLILTFMSILNYSSWQLLGIVFILKFIIDFILLFKAARYFKQIHVLPNYLLSSFIYPVFIMFVVIASFTSNYSWKGREFKK